MSEAREIIKKLPKKASEPTEPILASFFDDFSGYRHARAKISTDFESAQSTDSFDTNKPYIYDKKIGPYKGGLKILGPLGYVQRGPGKKFF